METFGRIAHGSMPFLGDCAVRHMGAVVAEMEASLFPALAARRTAMPVVPEAARASTLNINSVHGGQAERPADFTGWPAPVVPDSCRMIIDRRFLAEERLDEVKAEFRDVVERAQRGAGDFRYEIRDMHEVLPTMTERGAPVAAALARARSGGCSGAAPEFVVSPGTYDQKHIDRIGRLRNCVAYGPGILDLAHQPDEYVGVDDMIDAATVMALTLADLLGAAKADRRACASGDGGGRNEATLLALAGGLALLAGAARGAGDRASRSACSSSRRTSTRPPAPRRRSTRWSTPTSSRG